MKKKFFISALIALTIATPFVAQAQWEIGQPLVPCGLQENHPSTDWNDTLPCSACDILRLIRNVMDFILIMMVPVGALLFVFAGILILMGGAYPAGMSWGRSIFSTTFWGIVMLLLSWVIANTIITSLAPDGFQNPAGNGSTSNWWEINCIAIRPGTGGPGPGPGPGQGGQLAISTPSLSDGAQDQPYNQAIQATGGQTPFTWSVSAGSLPPGVTLNTQTGALTGTPTAAGNFTFTVSVTDGSSSQQSATRQFQLRIAPPGQTVTISNVQVSEVTNNTAVITWTTNVPATSRVQYGATTGYGQETAPTSTQQTNHRVSLTGLTAGTLYHARAVSGITGFLAQSNDVTFTTTGGVGVQCPHANTNLCQPIADSCSNSSCAQYSASIQRHAGGAATVNLLKAIMFRESSCNINAASDSSYGLMQLQPSTASLYKSQCGVDQITNIDRAWLTNPANADATICMGANYIRTIAAGTCGSNVLNIAAGYNGGDSPSGACGPSRDCPNEPSCIGGAKRRWECPFSNTAHTACDEGFAETRNYAPRVLYCNNNPGF